MSALASFPPPAFLFERAVGKVSLLVPSALFFLSLTSLCQYKHKKTNHLSHSTVFIMLGRNTSNTSNTSNTRNTSNTKQQGQEQHKAEHRTKAKLVKGRKPFEFRGVTNYHVRKKHGATRSNTWQQDENNTKRNTEPSKASKKNLSRFENVTSSEALGERLQDEGERWPLLRLELNARVINGRVPSRRL